MTASFPTMQFPRREGTLSAAFLSSELGAPAALFDRQGAVRVITPEGGCKAVTVREPPARSAWEAAQIWVDTLDEDAWYVVASTSEYAVTSGLQGSVSATRSSEVLWNEPLFVSKL